MNKSHDDVSLNEQCLINIFLDFQILSCILSGYEPGPSRVAPALQTSTVF